MNKTFTENRNSIIVGLILAALTLFVASWYIAQKQKEYRYELTVRLTEQDALMFSLSEMLARESADSVTNQIIQDCSLENRERFDTLLGSLSQLNRTELIEVDNLFDDCGDFYAKRQAIVTMRLGRELEVYEDYIHLMQSTDADARQFTQRLGKWSSLYALEVSRSSLTTKLVNIQDDIIVLLREGESVQSEPIKEILQAAQTTRDSIVMLNTKVAELRASLSSI